MGMGNPLKGKKSLNRSDKHVEGLLEDLVNDTVSPYCEVFYIIYNISLILSEWMLMILNFFYSGFILIIKDEVLMYMAQNASLLSDF
jgi:hypothetical protein